MRMEQNNMDSSKVLVNTETGQPILCQRNQTMNTFQTLDSGKRPLISLKNFME